MWISLCALTSVLINVKEMFDCICIQQVGEGEEREACSPSGYV